MRGPMIRRRFTVIALLALAACSAPPDPTETEGAPLKHRDAGLDATVGADSGSVTTPPENCFSPFGLPGCPLASQPTLCSGTVPPPGCKVLSAIVESPGETLFCCALP